MNIDPTSSFPTAPVTSTASTSAADAPSATTPAATVQEAAVSVEVSGASAAGATPSTDVPATPPQSVMDAIDTAQGAYDKLTAAGKQVSFGTDPETGAFTATLTHADGSTESLTGSDALAIASGEEF